ncbi:MAG: glucosamine-6-phosphate deaminase [Candidatus Caldatribacteriota bacterium]|nr:glucosamine-6-phosphate deaminase [Candidatus Caldatribacteriota bacterium]
MKVVVAKDYNELSFKAAQLIAEQITKKRNSVLGLATGSTPEGMYKELIHLNQENKVDFSKVVTFNLDEYYGLSPEHPQSYYFFMWNKFFKYINIKKENVHLLNGITGNIDKECSQYENLIKKSGKIDLQILGIGDNGHIGFNEPDISLNTKTHVVNLTTKTIRANSRFFSIHQEKVPKKAITMGIGTIMRAGKIILLANGKRKARVIEKTINGLVTTKVPATVLQLHNDVTIIVDREAASQFKDQR